VGVITRKSTLSEILWYFSIGQDKHIIPVHPNTRLWPDTEADPLHGGGACTDVPFSTRVFCAEDC
jgi:hypothetical protein